jgi:flagellar assembly protein FliH
MTSNTPGKRSAEVFKSLIQNGRVEQLPPAPAVLPKPPAPFIMPVFDESAAGAGGDEPSAAEDEPGRETPAPEPFPMPSLNTAAEEISPDLKIRKHTHAKEKIFLPLITEDADEDPVQAVKRELDAMRAQAKAQAEELLNNARQTLKKAEETARCREEESSRLRAEAEELLQKARDDAPRILQEAKEEGFNDGYKDGEEQGIMAGKARVEALILDFAAAVEKTGRMRAHILAAMEKELAGLLEACLDRFFLAPDSVEADLTARMVKALIKRLDEDERITVRLNPGNMEQMARLAPEIWRELKNLPGALFVADANLHAGDCIIDTPITQVDATVATRRERIFHLLEEMAAQDSISGPHLEQILSRAEERQTAREYPESSFSPEPLTPENASPPALHSAPPVDDGKNAEDEKKTEDISLPPAAHAEKTVTDDTWDDDPWDEPANDGRRSAPSGDEDW